jgi:hypothetical protein
MNVTLTRVHNTPKKYKILLQRKRFLSSLTTRFGTLRHSNAYWQSVRRFQIYLVVNNLSSECFA